jgi:hypothetical protein
MTSGFTEGSGLVGKWITKKPETRNPKPEIIKPTTIN